MRHCEVCRKDIKEGDRHLVLALYEKQTVSHPDSNPSQPFKGWRFCSQQHLMTWLAQEHLS